MIRVDNLNVENFDIKEFIQVFPGSIKQYLDYRVQIVWFRNVYPEGAILPSNPEPDPYRTPDTYVCSCDIYRNVKDPIPASRRCGIASPRLDGEITEDGRKLDNPYALSQIIAISNALETLGFMPDVLTNAEKEALERELLGIPAGEPLPEEIQNYNNETVVTEKSSLPEELKIKTAEPVVEEPKVEATTEAPKSKRGRPSKAELEARKAAEEATESKVEPVVEEAKVEETPIITETSTIEIKESDKQDGYTFNSVEEAEAVPCNYRNLSDKTMGEIIQMSKEQGKGLATSFLDWLERSDHAQEKNPEAYAALKYIQKYKNS